MMLTVDSLIRQRKTYPIASFPITIPIYFAWALS
jgi:hypothetical protein